MNAGTMLPDWNIDMEQFGSSTRLHGYLDHWTGCMSRF